MPASVTTVRVRYAETDQMGVVYYANYFVWFEVARADLLRTLGWTYREMEEAGVLLPVIEAHCEYRRPARYDDEVEDPDGGDARCRRSAWSSTTRCSVKGQAEIAADRPDGPRGARPRRPAVPAAGSDSRGLRMKALVTGAAGFIGSHLSAVARRRAASTSSASTASPTTTRARSRKRTSRRSRTRAQFRFVEGALQTVDLGAAPRRRDARLSPGRAGRRAQELGRGLPVYTSHNVDATQRLLEAVKDRDLARFVYASSSSVYGDVVAIPMREDVGAPAGLAVRRHEAGGRAPLLPLPRELRRADRVPAVLHGLRPAAAAGHGVPPFHAGGADRPADCALRRRRADPRLHVRRRRRRGDRGGGRPRTARRRL